MDSLENTNPGQSLRELLRLFVEQACRLTRARYGALGVVNAERTELDDFITHGLTEAQHAAIGPLPRGRGLLGSVMSEGKTLRTDDLAADPRAVGFPPNHPPMKTFLGTPLRLGEEIFGNFYLTDKEGGAPFTAEDAERLEAFSVQAALALGYAHQVEQLEHLREEVFAIVAHDLRNPIQAIRLQLDLLGRHAKGRPAVEVPVEALERILKSVDRMNGLVNDLLEASRIDRRALDLEKSEFDLGEMVDSLLQQMSVTLVGHGVQRATRGADSLRVVADRGRIEQVLINLLVNASKYSAPGTPITVTVEARTEEGREGVELVVHDQGQGIAPEDLPHLFERYYQTLRAKKKRTGLGLGLYIVKGMVTAHGGRIWAESQVGKGSAFHFWLPRAQ